MKKRHAINLWIGLSFCVAGLCAEKQEQSPSSAYIPREVLFGNPQKTSPKISPDGKKLAYLAPDANNVLNVWVKDLDQTSSEDRQVTSDQKRGISSFAWQYSNEHVLYVQDKDGDENWHLYQTNIQTKLTRDLTPFQGATAALLAYEPEYPHELLLTLNIRNPSLFDVYRLNLQNGALELEEENLQNAIQWVSDVHLKVRGMVFYQENGSTVIQVRDAAKGAWKPLLEWSALEQGDVLGFSPNGQSLYVTSTLGEKTEKLFEIDLKTKDRKVLAQDPEYDLSSTLLQNPVTHALEAIGVQKERFEWIALDPKVKKDISALQKKNAEFYITSRDLKDEKWIILHNFDTKSPSFSLYERTLGQETPLFTANPALDQYTLSKMHPVSFKARDGMTLYGYMTLPAGMKSKNLPTVLFVHGGPWVRDIWGYNSTVQWLANRGYAVLQVNFRGSTGYGKDYLNAGNREWAGKMQTDLLDGKAWMIEQGYSDPQKVAIMGGSYGGYATLVGLAFTPEAFCCGVDIVGPSNLVSLLETIPPYWGPFRTIFDVRLGNLKTDKSFLESISPLFKADQICRPLFIAQGANDPRVKQSESDQIVHVMKEKGKHVEYMLIADEGHGFSRPENKIKFAEAVEAFLDKYLKQSP